MEFSPSEEEIITEEITKLLKRGDIEQTPSLQLDFGFLPSCDCLSLKLIKVSWDPWGS